MADRSLVLIQDFYEDPDAVRAEALSLDYPITGKFPGRNSLNHRVEESLGRVSKALNMRVVYDPRSTHITFFRLTRGSDQGRSDIHVDPFGWAGVCYLNPGCHGDGGTSLFRHKETGLTRWPTREEQARLRDAGVIGPSPDPQIDDVNYYFKEESKRREAWEEIHRVSAQYNLAVFYRGNQFHSITAWDRFGDDRETARLTRVFFFHEKEQPKVWYEGIKLDSNGKR